MDLFHWQYICWEQAHRVFYLLACISLLLQDYQKSVFPAVDLLAQVLRKGAAKCDKHCDVRDPVNR